MAFNDVNQMVSTFKTWDHVGNIVPPVEHSEGIRPHLGDTNRPASWLPVQFYDKKFENWVVIMPGKILAQDPDGCLMPAEYGAIGATVSYTQNDIDAGVIDVATGLAVTTVKTVTLSQLSGVRGSVWTLALAGVAGVNRTSGFMGRFGISFADATKKYPIGVASMPLLQWAGGDGFNPASYRQLNYNMQHRACILCDYVLRLPLVPAQDANDAVNTTVTVAPPVAGTVGTYTRTQIQLNATGRYNATYGTVPVLTTYPVMALFVDNVNLATQTSRTLIALASDNTADDLSAILVNERTSLSAITMVGDYYVDKPFGAIFFYAADGATMPVSLSGADGNVTITYYYDAAPATVSKFACVVGAPVGGDYLVLTTNSNYAVNNAADFKDIIGQVIGFETYPQGGLDRVRTAYNPAIATNASGGMANGSASSLSVNPGQLDQMPGSATGGHPDLIHFAGAADKIVIINLISK